MLLPFRFYSNIVHLFLHWMQSHASCQVQILFSLYFSSMKFHISCRIRFLSPALFVKSTCLSILFAIRLVRIVNSPRAFSVLIWALLKTSLVLRFVCGHCDRCGNTSVRPSRLESSSRSVSYKYIGSGSTFRSRSWLT